MEIQLSDVSLHCLDTGTPDSGSTGETILFVHGFPLDHTMWSAQTAEFSKTHRCIAPDLRGFGASGVTAGTVTMSQFADDLNELLQQLGIDGPIIVCGLSMGGYIAFELWNRHPNRVGRLVLCDTRAKSDSTEVARGRAIMANQVEQNGMSGVSDGMVPKLIAAGSGVAKGITDVIDSADPNGVAAAQRGMAKREDFTERLSEISIPTLVVCGEQDVITPIEEMRSMTDAVFKSVFAVIPEAGHLAPLEQPAKVNEAVRAWLNS